MSGSDDCEPLPSVALLAGGLATRLRPMTKTIPKSMIEVAGEPFIAHQLRLLANQEITSVVICAGYLGAQIEDFVGDGARFGCTVRYSWDGERLLGTGGALRRSLSQLGTRFFVMYGDSYLPIAFRPVWNAFRSSGCLGMMTVFRNEGKWVDSNVEFRDGAIRCYDKVNRTSQMGHLDYGLCVLDAAAVAPLPLNEPFDLADLYSDLVRRSCLAAYEVGERFYEVGSLAGIAATDLFLRERGASQFKPGAPT